MSPWGGSALHIEPLCLSGSWVKVGKGKQTICSFFEWRGWGWKRFTLPRPPHLGSQFSDPTNSSFQHVIKRKKKHLVRCLSHELYPEQVKWWRGQPLQAASLCLAFPTITHRSMPTCRQQLFLPEFAESLKRWRWDVKHLHQPPGSINSKSGWCFACPSKYSW